jgi:hypothetical protein
MTNYQLGKIYTIVCNTTGLTYYGSTCEPTLARRLSGHVGKCKNFKEGKTKKYVTSFKILEGGNYTIVLVELFPCDSKMKLHQRERYYIENNECVNKNIPTRTEAEWRLENSNYGADYRINNKEKISQYALLNRVHILEKKNEYYSKNKEKLLQYHAERYLENREKLLQYQIEYVEKNREKRIAYKAEYYLKNKEEINRKKRAYLLKKKELKSNPPLGEITE